jgi:hypothetical protein
MEQWIIIGVVLVVFIGGTLVAMLWWNLAAKAAPYEDEAGKPPRARRDEEDVIVIPRGPADAGTGRPGAQAQSGGGSSKA